MRVLPTFVVALCLAGLTLAFQEQAAKSAPESDEAVIARQLPSYPLTDCPISHESLDAMGKPLDFVHEGRLVRLCCKSCVKGFKKDATSIAATLKQIDEAVIKAQKDSYALKTCPVSGEELGSMGDAYDHVHGTRLVRLCCKSCLKTFTADPAKPMAKIDAALIAEQKKTYPLTTCLVCSKTIESAGVDQLYGTRLTRFCSNECAASFAKEPAKHLAQLDKAAPKKD
jgi:hypothetical protein